jgi:hypothetical protein
MELVLLGSRAFPLLHGRRHEGLSDGVPAPVAEALFADWEHHVVDVWVPTRWSGEPGAATQYPEG